MELRCLLLLQLGRLLCVCENILPERLGALLEFGPYCLCLVLVPESQLCEFLLIFLAGGSLCFLNGCCDEVLDGGGRGRGYRFLYLVR